MVGVFSRATCTNFLTELSHGCVAAGKVRQATFTGSSHAAVSHHGHVIYAYVLYERTLTLTRANDELRCAAGE
jgi:hypothetical protein